MGKKFFLPERAQQLWELGFSPSRIDELMKWPLGSCHDKVIDHWRKLGPAMPEEQLWEAEDDEPW